MDRLMVTCGLVVRGGANDIDSLLSHIQNQGIQILRKEVEAYEKIWLVIGDKPNSQGREMIR